MGIDCQDMTLESKTKLANKRGLKEDTDQFDTPTPATAPMSQDLPWERWSPCQGRLHGSVQHRAWRPPVAPPVLKWAIPGSSWWSLPSFSQPGTNVSQYQNPLPSTSHKHNKTPAALMGDASPMNKWDVEHKQIKGFCKHSNYWYAYIKAFKL